MSIFAPDQKCDHAIAEARSARLEINRHTSRAQAEIEAHEELLEIKRESISRVAWCAHEHLKDLLIALDIADDNSAWRHCKSMVSNVRAVAILVNDLYETAGSGQ